MKLLIINSSSEGGAFTAAMRLYKSFEGCEGVNVKYLHPVRYEPNNPNRIVRRLLLKFIKLFEFIILGERPGKDVPFSLGLYSYPSLEPHAFSNDVDLINLHWLGQGYISLNFLKKTTKPILITMHDSWFFTGGCYLPGNCRQYETGCKDCPIFKTRKAKRKVEDTFNFKKEIYKSKRVHFISPSNWLNENFIRSMIYSGDERTVIHNVLDDTWKDQPVVQNKLPRAVFASLNPFNDKNKNFKLALKICDEVNKYIPLDIIVVGDANIPLWAVRPYLKAVPLQHDVNKVKEIFSASAYVFSTSKQENLPNVILEAAHVGTKAIATPVGGIPELKKILKHMIIIDEDNIQNTVREIVNELKDKNKMNSTSLELNVAANTKFQSDQTIACYLELMERLTCE